MDIAVSKKKSMPKAKWYIVLAVLTVPVIFIANYLWSLGQADLSIAKEKLVFDDVKRGKFTVSVRGTGVLVPNNIQWLATDVDATVKRVVLKLVMLLKQVISLRS